MRCEYGMSMSSSLTLVDWWKRFRAASAALLYCAVLWHSPKGRGIRRPKGTCRHNNALQMLFWSGTSPGMAQQRQDDSVSVEYVYIAMATEASR